MDRDDETTSLRLFRVFWSVWSSAMDCRFKVNDWVICTREKYSLSPGRRAKNISPSPHGELYSYEVDKYWIVRQVLPDLLVLETRTGKHRQLPIADRRLRHPTWWERFFYADRFPKRSRVTEVAGTPPSGPATANPHAIAGRSV